MKDLDVFNSSFSVNTAQNTVFKNDFQVSILKNSFYKKLLKSIVLRYSIAELWSERYTK